MNNIELFKKLLTITKKIHDKEESILNILNVEQCQSSNEIDDLLDCAKELIGINDYSELEDIYYDIVVDYILEHLDLEETISKIQELINK